MINLNTTARKSTTTHLTNNNLITENLTNLSHHGFIKLRLRPGIPQKPR